MSADRAHSALARLLNPSRKLAGNTTSSCRGSAWSGCFPACASPGAGRATPTVSGDSRPLLLVVSPWLYRAILAEGIRGPQPT